MKDVVRALAVAVWGHRRWNIENGFKVEKHDGVGLEHTFCNDDRARRNYHILMQIAYALWQVFARCACVGIGWRADAPGQAAARFPCRCHGHPMRRGEGGALP